MDSNYPKICQGVSERHWTTCNFFSTARWGKPGVAWQARHPAMHIKRRTSFTTARRHPSKHSGTGLWPGPALYKSHSYECVWWQIQSCHSTDLPPGRNFAAESWKMPKESHGNMQRCHGRAIWPVESRSST